MNNASTLDRHSLSLPCSILLAYVLSLFYLFQGWHALRSSTALDEEQVPHWETFSLNANENWIDEFKFTSVCCLSCFPQCSRASVTKTLGDM